MIPATWKFTRTRRLLSTVVDVSTPVAEDSRLRRVLDEAIAIFGGTAALDTAAVVVVAGAELLRTSGDKFCKKV